MIYLPSINIDKVNSYLAEQSKLITCRKANITEKSTSHEVLFSWKIRTIEIFYYLAKFCNKLQSEIIAPQQLNNSFGVAKLNSHLACVAHLAAAGNLAELVQFSSR